MVSCPKECENKWFGFGFLAGAITTLTLVIVGPKVKDLLLGEPNQ